MERMELRARTGATAALPRELGTRPRGAGVVGTTAGRHRPECPTGERSTVAQRELEASAVGRCTLVTPSPCSSASPSRCCSLPSTARSHRRRRWSKRPCSSPLACGRCGSTGCGPSRSCRSVRSRSAGSSAPSSRCRPLPWSSNASRRRTCAWSTSCSPPSLGLVALVLWRAAYRAFLNAERRRGRFTSRVVVVGTGRQANDLTQLFLVHPELGHAGDGRHRRQAGGGRIGDGPSVEGDVRPMPATVLVVARRRRRRALLGGARSVARSTICPPKPALAGPHAVRRPRSVRHRLQAGAHHGDRISAAARDVVGNPDRLAGGDQAGLRHRRRRLRRGAHSAPAGGRCALLIKLEDRGPVLFRQERVGRDGATFEILKFRTMVVDAEPRLAELAAPQRAQRPAVQDGRRTTRGSRASVASCGRRASTSCPSCSTCSTGR